jgi:hypothetical protein
MLYNNKNELWIFIFVICYAILFGAKKDESFSPVMTPSEKIMASSGITYLLRPGCYIVCKLQQILSRRLPIR